MADDENITGEGSDWLAWLTDAELAHEIAEAKKAVAELSSRIALHDEVIKIIGTLTPDEWPIFREFLVSLVDPASLIDARHERVWWPTAISVAVGGSPAAVHAASVAFLEKVEARRLCRGGPVSRDAASLAEAESAYLALETAVDRKAASATGNEKSADRRGKKAKGKDDEVARLVEALPEHDRRNAPAALDALNRDGHRLAGTEGEIKKRIRAVLAALRKPRTRAR